MQGRLPNVLLKRERQTCESVFCAMTVVALCTAAEAPVLAGSLSCACQGCTEPSGAAVTAGPCPPTEGQTGTGCSLDPGVGIFVCTVICWVKGLIKDSSHMGCVFKRGTCCRFWLCSATLRGDVGLTHRGAGSGLCAGV